MAKDRHSIGQGSGLSDEALLARAQAQQRAGQLGPAEQVYRDMLARFPKNSRITGLLALLLVQKGCNTEACDVIEQAVAAGGGDATLFNAQALALGARARFPAAAAAAERAAALKPDVAELQINLGNARRRAGQGEAARAAYRRAVELAPSLPTAHIGLGTAEAALGEAEAAAAAFRQALSLDPSSARAFYHLALVAKANAATIDAEVVERFARRAAASKLSTDEQVLVHSALGVLADRNQIYTKAFAHFRASKEATRRRLDARGEAFDAVGHTVMIDGLIAAFPSDRPQAAAAKSSQHRPIFIVGVPRSGTTLVEQILASHSQVTAGGELPHMPHLAAQIGDDPAAASRLDETTVSRLRRDYLAALADLDEGAAHVTDKLPLNFLHLGLIARLFPGATVVHCRRDARDTCLSCYLHNFRSGNAFTCDLTDLGRFYKDYRRLMAHWRQVLPLTLVEVDYEDMVRSPEPSIRALVAACALDWEAACLNSHQGRRSVGTASQLQVRQAIHGGAVGRWRNYADQLAPLLEMLGDDQA